MHLIKQKKKYKIDHMYQHHYHKSKKQNKKQVTIMLEPCQKERGKELTDMTGMSFSELVSYLIDNAK